MPSKLVKLPCVYKISYANNLAACRLLKLSVKEKHILNILY